MHKKLILLLAVLLIPLASAADIAYILGSGTVSQNVVDEINFLGLSYDEISNTEISSTDFSQYSLLVIPGRVSNVDLLPLDTKHAIFFDRDTADEVWSLVSTSSTSGREVKITDTTSFLFDGISIPVNDEIDLYPTSGGAMHLLTLSGSSGAQSVAVKAGGNRPIIAHSFRNNGGIPVRDVFIGLPSTNSWLPETKLIFRNALAWALENIDQDSDGFNFGEDCNDQDPDSYPGATEIPYDLKDQDCNGHDLIDVDGDLYCAQGSLVTNSLIQCPLDTNPSGSDCQDSDSGINPNNPDLTLNCLNDPPTIQTMPSFLSANEGETIQFQVTATDPENDVLTYAINDPRFSVSENQLTWQTEFDDSGFYTFTVTVSDADFQDSQTINIEIFDANQPPISSTIFGQSWDEDSTFSLDLTDYFSDTDNDPLTFGIADSSGLEKISVSINEQTGLVDFTQEDDFFGEEWVVFYADDGFSRTESNAVTLTVININDPLEFQGTIPNITWNEDVVLFEEIDLYDYFIDIDSELEFEAFGNSEVTIEIDDGFVTFSPSQDWFGIENIFFTATDGQFIEQSNTLTLTVIEQGEPPIFDPHNCNTNITEDTQETCTFSASDFENNSLTFSVSSQDNLLCEFNGNVLTYLSDSNYNGEASCVLKVSDIHGFDEQTLTVNISPVNDAPQIISATPDQHTVRVVEGFSQVFSIKAIDIDSGFLTSWFFENQPGVSTTDSESEFTMSPQVPGTYSLEAVVSDDELTTNKLWNIIVGPVSDFTCSEVNGFICEHDQTCGSEFLGVKDSNVCCATSCIPAFKDADSCSVLDPNIRIEVVKINDNEDIEIGEDLKVEFKVYNDLEEEQDFEIEAHLYNIDEDESVAEFNSDTDIAGSNSRTFRFDLEVSEELDLTDQYAIYLKAEDDVCTQEHAFIDIKRPKDLIFLSDFDFPEHASCGETIQSKLKVENLGQKDQSVEITIENRDLDIDETIKFDVDQHDGDNDRETRNLAFTIPEDLESGVYTIRTRLFYAEERETFNDQIEISCRDEPETFQGSNSEPEKVSGTIVLNQLEGNTNQALQNNKNPSSQIGMLPILILMMLNLVLVGSGAFLYLVHMKKTNKRRKR